MTAQQRDDFINQQAYLEFASHEQGYETIEDLFSDEPELFDTIASEYRSQNFAL